MFEVNETVINLILSVKCKASIKTKVLRIIIEDSLNHSYTKFPVILRWTRNFMDIIVDFEDENCISLLSRIYSRIRASEKKEINMIYNEIEWLTTKCWNEGVSLIMSGKSEGGSAWCKQAIKFSPFVNERLESQLLELWPELTKAADCSNN
ncbi:uncharacterized protein ASCRUDRAFT_128752 [Ascoidea rubescens DSM 1968]|uniref:Uncharacterized protein n=1 Tax=Ascoidea rubescens DSM 1968 TaxID=1344418 RepID=A0A1D2V978_9ASCO|nr:hypothetical protein ASCRUDRAFT_128752 [Ascoidea rubescens DSM 1968]ODV58212.1 hypothetical protein ASCRUDRAFT_128752 [Ascoidea rubescens DSM 1968]